MSSFNSICPLVSLYAHAILVGGLSSAGMCQPNIPTLFREPAPLGAGFLLYGELRSCKVISPAQ